jgi:hypothetical protein
MNVPFPPFKLLTGQVRGVLPLEQEVVAPDTVWHTSKFVTLARTTLRVAVLVTLSEPAVMVDVPAATPSIETLPHGAVAQAPVICATLGSLLDQDTPLFR